MNPSTPNATGRWEGSLTYGKYYGPTIGKKLHFGMQLVQDGQNLTGEAMDIEGVGMSPDKATIHGEMLGYQIQFVKQYLHFHYSDGTGDATIVDRSKPGHLIYYQGLYNGITDEISGNWYIKSRAMLFGIISIPIRARGTWTMKRV